MVEPLTLSLDSCRKRQQRLREALAELPVDRAVVLSPENIQYLTGFRPHRLMHAAVCLDVEGYCILVAPNELPEHVVADEVVTFPAQELATLRQDQPDSAFFALWEYLKTGSSIRTAMESPYCRYANMPVNLDETLWQLRRKKDPDELAMIRRAIECTEAMYAEACEIIKPGISELEVYSQLHAAAVRVAGEPLTALGNDFQSNSPGGPPRDRLAQASELFILDLGPAYRGYYADNCRTFAVDGKPTDEQLKAWEVIVEVLEMVEETVRPGVSCRDLYDTATAMLDEYAPGAFFHHLGHGFGLYPHETPHLNPHWDDEFREGDVFTAEPGLYTEALKAGIRLEQDYLVTADGVERLT
ncbi:MAG: aminopeptidase P family protein, partial [Planctomycetaceae bacterium]|nr:aminopeptidase P family protein [Planctomycetaceae bacterium]